MKIDDWEKRMKGLFISQADVHDVNRKEDFTKFSLKFQKSFELSIDKNSFVFDEPYCDFIWLHYYFTMSDITCFLYFLENEDHISFNISDANISGVKFFEEGKTVLTKEEFLMKSDKHKMLYKSIEEHHIKKAKNRLEFCFH